MRGLLGQGGAFLGAVLEGAEGREKTFSEEEIEEKKNPRFETEGFGCHLPGGR